LDQNSSYEWRNGILWYKERTYLTSSSKFKIKALKNSYDSLAMRHVGSFKTYGIIHDNIFIGKE